MCVCARVDLICCFFSSYLKGILLLFVPFRFSVVWNYTVTPIFSFNG